MFFHVSGVVREFIDVTIRSHCCAVHPATLPCLAQSAVVHTCPPALDTLHAMSAYVALRLRVSTTPRNSFASSALNSRLDLRLPSGMCVVIPLYRTASCKSAYEHFPFPTFILAARSLIQRKSTFHSGIPSCATLGQMSILPMSCARRDTLSSL